MPKITPLNPNRPRKLGETVWSERGLSLPLIGPRIGKFCEVRWPFMVLIASPIVGVLAAIAWHLI